MFKTHGPKCFLDWYIILCNLTKFILYCYQSNPMKNIHYTVTEQFISVDVLFRNYFRSRATNELYVNLRNFYNAVHKSVVVKITKTGK